MLNLNWNNFGENLSSLVKDFRNDKDFFDVTLLCEDGQLISANKFMLSCCSTFFKFVFKKAAQNNVVIYLKGVKGNQMNSILDFIYHGSTNVHENQLTTFLETANDLKIRGLVETSKLQRLEAASDSTQEQSARTRNRSRSQSGNSIKRESPSPLNADLAMTDDSSYAAEELDHVEIDENELVDDPIDPNFGQTGKTSSHQTPDKRMSLYHPDQTVKSSISPYKHNCTVCGKSFSYRHVLENHIETHYNNAYPCDVCQKIFKTRNSLKSHLSQKHRDQKQPSIGHSSI